jgi:hypothetical protein
VEYIIYVEGFAKKDGNEAKMDGGGLPTVDPVMGLR